MNPVRFTFRAINRLLAVAGLRLDRLDRDYDNIAVDEPTLAALITALAAAYDSWAARQTIFVPRASFDTVEAVRAFFTEWRERPFRGRQGGSRFNNLLWLHLIAKAFDPDVIVDSGTFRGGSAWALNLACPRARTLSFDIDMSQLSWRTAGVNYIPSDWVGHPLDLKPTDRLLCYFDDHLDQVQRLLEAAERGCQLAIFDDDLPVTSFFIMAPNAHVLPKLEFALDPSLADGRRLEWRFHGKTLDWIVDRAYLDAGAAAIGATERLPDTSMITGIHQAPYRIVAVAPRSAAQTVS
jgi:hypothetical protein